MDNLSIEEIYKIEKDKLLRYYERLKGQFIYAGPTQIIAQFLVNQSVSLDYNHVYNTLIYFRDKLEEGKELLDLAFEWVRAQKIRLEYKKYLSGAQYPNNNLSLAVDDCIFKFFLEYDKYIRKLLKKDIREHNLSVLYEIFFSPYESKNLNIQDILERHIDNVPTYYHETEKLNTNIIILRSGMSIIIVKDYEDVLFVRKEEKLRKEIKFKRKVEEESGIESKFEGILIERMIKTYCISNEELSEKEIENAVSQFLSSYFKFGTLYNFDSFKDLLIQNLAEDIYSGLSEKLKQANTLENIKYLILNIITIFRKTNKTNKLDGMAWKKDLTPVLKTFVLRFITNLSS
ncbi:MAG: hypothetical protein ACFFC3_14355 [Candidatus Odinarchaeota archaeon]